MKIMKLLACLLLAGCLWSCVSKGKPSEIGQVLTIEQIAELGSDDSWNGKLVAVKGYPSFSSRLIKTGIRNFLSVAAIPGGEELIRVNVSVVDADKEGTIIAGAKPRNLVRLISGSTDIGQAQFVLDDYDEVGYGEFLFSGTLVYDGNKVYLEKATIHKVQ